MKFIPSRDLRLKTGEVFEKLKEEGEIVVTSNGIPVCLLIPIDEDNLEVTLNLIRSLKVKESVRNIREGSLSHRVMDEDISREIDLSRIRK